MTQLAIAMALYFALIAGLALHGLDMPDPTATSSVSNQITDLSVACPTGATGNSLCRDRAPAASRQSERDKHHEPVSGKARRARHQLDRQQARCTHVRLP